MHIAIGGPRVGFKITPRLSIAFPANSLFYIVVFCGVIVSRIHSRRNLMNNVLKPRGALSPGSTSRDHPCHLTLCPPLFIRLILWLTFATFPPKEYISSERHFFVRADLMFVSQRVSPSFPNSIWCSEIRGVCKVTGRSHKIDNRS